MKKKHLQQLWKSWGMALAMWGAIIGVFAGQALYRYLHRDPCTTAGVRIEQSLLNTPEAWQLASRDLLFDGMSRVTLVEIASGTTLDVVVKPHWWGDSYQLGKVRLRGEEATHYNTSGTLIIHHAEPGVKYEWMPDGTEAPTRPVFPSDSDRPRLETAAKTFLTSLTHKK